MKIKLLDYTRPNLNDNKRDVTVGKVYDVVNDSYRDYHGSYFLIMDDVGHAHQVLQKDCEIVVPSEPIEWASTVFDKIKTFTMNHKDIEISFEDGKIVVRNWDIRFKEPVDYHVDTIEQLEEFMDAFEVVMKFCKVEDV